MAAAVVVYGTSGGVPDGLVDHVRTIEGPVDWRVWTAAASHDPLDTGHDDPPPQWTLTLLTETDDRAREIGAGLRTLLADRGATVQVMDEHRYVVGEKQKTIHDCAVSYFVVYHGPAVDPAAFVDHYLDHHVPTMARLPEIEAMSIFVPPEPDAGGDLLVCQVCFASLDRLNAALASPIRHELRQGAQAFPAFEGPPVHQAMLRGET